MPTLRFNLYLLVCLGLLLSANPVRADELTIKVKGIKGAPLTNVRARVEPFRLTGNARLSRRKLEEIRESSERRARSALQPYGYYDPTITSEISRAGERAWLLQLTIKLGPPVKVANLALELTGPGASLEDLSIWKSDWPLTPGKRLNQARWESEKQKALDIAEDNGYLGAVFSEHRLEVDLEKNEASLYLVLDTGIQAVMGDIQFGQDSVKPYVMENLPRFRPGDPYSSWMMEKFRLDVWKTGYFENIEVIENRRMDQSPPVVDLMVRVEPRKKNTYQGTLGYGSDTGPRLLFSWNRHLISGNGDSFSLGTGYQQHNNEFFVRGNYRVPRNVRSREFWTAEALGRNQNQDLEVNVDDADQTRFKLADSTVTDYSLRLGRLKVRDQESGYRQLFETMYVQYLNENANYKPDFRNPEDVIRRLQQESTDSEWRRSTQTVTLGIDYDMPLIRGEGFENVGYHHRAWAFTSNTAWGSESTFTQAYLSSRWNFIVGRRWKFLIRGEAGYSNAEVKDYSLLIDDTLLSLSITDLPNLYRFKAGGSNSVRGYSYESLTNNGIGSNNIVTASTEVEFQVLPKWSVAAFFDIGNAFNDWNNMDLKRGVGFGVRWYTIAGAVRVDLAKALDLPGDPWKLNFSIGISLL